MKKPLSGLLVKPAGADCNMACQYCFYNDKGSLYPGPKQHRMDDAVLKEMTRQMMVHGESEVSFCWQGGEPTLMGIDFFRRAVDYQMQYGRGKTVGNAIQTNGLLIDQNWADFLFDYRFLTGISLDGPQHIHDRYRRMAGGAASWAKTTDATKRLLDRGVSVNALSVLNDYSARYPDEIYGFLKEAGLSYMQFIPCVETDPAAPGRAAPYSVSSDDYGRFLCRIFDLWLADFQDGRPATSIRFFESLLFSYADIIPPDCSLMDECGIYLVVEHNGDVYSCDFFVTPENRLGNVMTDRLDNMLNSVAQKNFGKQKKSLPSACLNCAYLRLCRGGCPKDRIRDPADNGMNHFCGAYKMFFDHAGPELQNIVDVFREKQRSSGTIVREPSERVGRNQPCPCGSGRKYKKCCGAAV
ncbi:MAG: anaerobic sulfatase maturase [Desulfobacteraceae bacterium]|jgi:uncharacterized protein|nr:MAG: anaerobic sulfatase maturase [Desulfobacteraceae bacterium]